MFFIYSSLSWSSNWKCRSLLWCFYICHFVCPRYQQVLLAICQNILNQWMFYICSIVLFIQSTIICHLNHHNIPLTHSLLIYVLISLLKEMRIYHPKLCLFDTKKIFWAERQVRSSECRKSFFFFCFCFF